VFCDRMTSPADMQRFLELAEDRTVRGRLLDTMNTMETHAQSVPLNISKSALHASFHNRAARYEAIQDTNVLKEVLNQELLKYNQCNAPMHLELYPEVRSAFSGRLN
jgi:hypothetical protein